MQGNTPAHVQMRLDNCLWCGKPLPDGRYDRKTHNNCRFKVYRWKNTTKRYASQVKTRLLEIEKRLNYELSFADGITALKAIQEEINAIYARHNIVRVK